MDELTRRALARLPLSVGDVRLLYATAGRSEAWKTICESHERLRAELDGTTVLLRDAEVELGRLRNMMARMAAAVRLGMAVNGVESDGLAAIAAEMEREGQER